MKERPILFSGEMVNAILDGRKTQTRRVMSKQPLSFVAEPVLNHFSIRCDFGTSYCDLGGGNEVTAWTRFAGKYCPYGQPGDRLWVRECFSQLEYLDFFNPDLPEEIPSYWYWADGNPEFGDWTRPKPSIHMPRWASRITLEVKSVRVERLNDISEDDACAEGVECPRCDGQVWKEIGGDAVQCKYKHCGEGSELFRELWNGINGKKPGATWQDNPWVWVVEFEKIQEEQP